jgi:UrcA family protein
MKIAMLCALLFASAAPAIVHAADIGEEAAPSITVRFGDLDLSRKQDAKALLARIDDAAMESCGATAFSDPLEYTVVRRSACHADAMTRAVAKINVQALNAAFENERGSMAIASAD